MGTGAARESDIIAKATTRFRRRIVEFLFGEAVAECDRDCGELV